MAMSRALIKRRTRAKAEAQKTGPWAVIFALLCLLIAALLAMPKAFAQSEDRASALKSVQQLVHQNQSRLSEIDASIARLLKEAASMAVTQSSETKLTTIEQELERLSLQRQEHLLRQDFFDRLYFQLDKSYQGKICKAFCTNRL